MNNRKFKNWLKLNPDIAYANSGSIQDALNGDGREVYRSFSWARSPQGHSFWDDKYCGGKMSKRSRRFLAKLRDEAKRQGY